jgi:adenylosuccinate lyase
MAAFVQALDIGEDAKSRLLALTPAGYAGLAAEIADQV